MYLYPLHSHAFKQRLSLFSGPSFVYRQDGTNELSDSRNPVKYITIPPK